MGSTSVSELQHIPDWEVCLLSGQHFATDFIDPQMIEDHSGCCSHAVTSAALSQHARTYDAGHSEAFAVFLSAKFKQDC